MTGRHMARQRVAGFVRQWKDRYGPTTPVTVFGLAFDLSIADLDALSRPRRVIRTLAQLQALPAGTKLAVQGDRAAQIDKAEAHDEGTGEELEAKRLLYVGTDLYDNLLPDPSAAERDTLRRMLPAIVIDPLD